MLRKITKLLPYFIVEWATRKYCQYDNIYTLKNPYEYWNNNKEIYLEDLTQYNVFKFTDDCKLIVTNKDIIQRKIEKKEKELKELKSKLDY